MKINKMLFLFLWDNKPDKIKRDVIVKNYNEGGLKMLHIESFVNALKLSWIRKLITGDYKCTKFIETKVGKEFLCNFGDEYVQKCIDCNTNIFWKDVFKSYKLLVKCSIIDSHENFLKQPIFYNTSSSIKIGGSSVFMKDWYSKGIFL